MKENNLWLTYEADELDSLEKVCEDYRAFLDAGKTERECVTEIIRQAEEKGYRNLKYIIGSTDMSCHGRPMTDYAEELRSLESRGRAHFDYFVGYGFSPTGFIPNCYGEKYHGIVMIKPLI